jgi:hypothetical protein
MLTRPSRISRPSIVDLATGDYVDSVRCQGLRPMESRQGSCFRA